MSLANPIYDLRVQPLIDDAVEGEPGLRQLGLVFGFANRAPLGVQAKVSRIDTAWETMHVWVVYDSTLFGVRTS